VKRQVTDLSGSSITVQPTGGSPVTRGDPGRCAGLRVNVDDRVELCARSSRISSHSSGSSVEDDDDDDQGDDEGDDDGSGGGDGD
jgi:hypothetical protein